MKKLAPYETLNLNLNEKERQIFPETVSSTLMGQDNFIAICVDSLNTLSLTIINQPFMPCANTTSGYNTTLRNFVGIREL